VVEVGEMIKRSEATPFDKALIDKALIDKFFSELKLPDEIVWIPLGGPAFPLCRKISGWAKSPKQRSKAMKTTKPARRMRSFKFREDVMDKLATWAKKEGRSLTNSIETLILVALEKIKLGG